MGNRKMPLGAMALILAGLVAGCAAREPLPELVTARETVASVSRDPEAAAAGAIRLDEARKSLESAERAFAEREDDAVVRDLAYAASRNAEVAKEQGAEERARKAVAAGEADRNRVLLEARTEEAEQARATASANANVADANARAAAEARDEAERLKAEMADMAAQETARGMVVTLGDVLFDTAQAAVRPAAMAGLEKVSAFLAANPTFRAIVEGHTDSRGSDEYNRGLAQRRADAVAAVITRGGVAMDRVRATGLGEAYPVASNDNAAGQQQNRRVEIVFSDKEGRFAPGGERL